MGFDGLSKLSFGVYLVGAPDSKGGANALLAGSVMQASSDPNVVCVSINKVNLTHDFIDASRKFNISVVSEKADLEFLGLFGFKTGRDEDKLAKVKCSEHAGFSTVVQNCNAVIECEVIHQVDSGEATVFFGKVNNSKVISADKSMTNDYYQAVIEGRVSKNSPAWSARYVK